MSVTARDLVAHVQRRVARRDRLRILVASAAHADSFTWKRKYVEAQLADVERDLAAIRQLVEE